MDFFEDLHRFGDRTAVVDDRGRSFSYRELHRTARAFGARLPRGERSLILLRTSNRTESLVGYLGGILAGHAVLPVDHGIDAVLVARLMDAYRPEYVWGTGRETGPALFTMGDHTLTTTRYGTGEPLHADLGAVLLTSGSTGSPKGVRLTRANIAANARSIAEYLGLDETERPVTSLPMSYSYGLSVITSHLHAGATLLLTDASLVRGEFWDFFRKNGATSFSGVPYTYEMLDTLRFASLDLPSLRYFTQAGGRLPAERVERYAAEAERRGARFYVMYGQTEATARIAYLEPGLLASKPGSIGRAVPGGTLYLRDEHGVAVTAPGRTGSLCYEGPNVMQGHAGGRADLARGDELGGVLDTGDLAWADEDGCYYIAGRRGRFVKLSGIRYDLDALELGLAQSGITCACGGSDEQLAVAVEDPALVRQVKQTLRRTFHVDPTQVRVVQVPLISRTATGKIAYAQTFENGE
ncbi:AMP-binding protein [Streptomyces sp. NBC_01166]|uniref:AMP-binding protein n=1 Tax=Streptomyces sp. NBC_01166 TaxID=2903755 RepID=UPI0038647809|nr:AMP-binding protein [Streptomyces sp. NBC_01166]